MAVDVLATMMLVDLALVQPVAAADKGSPVALDIVAVIDVYFLHLNYFQIPMIPTAPPEFAYSAADFGPTNDKP